MNLKNFRTQTLAIEFCKECKTISLDNRAIRDQFDRAVISVALNISEGGSRPTSHERKRFYQIAMGSLRETQTLLQIIGQYELFKKSDILAAHLYKLIQNPGSW